jgi:hypothetical protein
MDVQTDIGHVVKMLAGNKPDDLALRIMAGQASEGGRSGRERQALQVDGVK